MERNEAGEEVDLEDDGDGAIGDNDTVHTETVRAGEMKKGTSITLAPRTSWMPMERLLQVFQ